MGDDMVKHYPLPASNTLTGCMHILNYFAMSRGKERYGIHCNQPTEPNSTFCKKHQGDVFTDLDGRVHT